MVALTKNTARDGKDSKLLKLPVKADVVIYRGALVKVGADGMAAPAASEAGAVFAGISRTPVDSTGIASGVAYIECESKDSFYADGAGFVAADLMKEVYAADDNTVQLAAGTDLQKVGRIVEVISATKVLVQPIEQARS